MRIGICVFSIASLLSAGVAFADGDSCPEESQVQCGEMNEACEKHQGSVQRMLLIQDRIVEKFTKVQNPTSSTFVKLTAIAQFNAYKLENSQELKQFCDQKFKSGCQACF